MGERIERIVNGIRELFEDLSVDIREERVLRYIGAEIHKGRDFDDVIEDPYVRNNMDSADRARLLENPETLRMIEEQLEDLR
ncbi:MAG: hypothetical protein Kow00129_00160 [Thermoleophilia bacterium]